MEQAIIMLIGAALVGILAGFFGGKSIANNRAKETLEKAKSEAGRIVETAVQEGEAKKKERLLEAKEKFVKLKADTEKQINKRKRSAEDIERKLKQERNAIKQKTDAFKGKEKDLDKLKSNLNDQLDVVKKKQEEMKARMKRFDKKEEELNNQHDIAKKELIEKLEKVSNLSADEAKVQLMDAMKRRAETEGMALVKEIIDESKLRATKEAKKIIIQTIQRTAAESSIENTVSVFNLDSDDIKGQIIGREGRNIRALEAATGVEIIVDDTPEAVIISGYDPLRRECARLSLQRLVADGRIHPARIEEIVAKTRKQLEQQIQEIGERTVIDLNIHGLHPQLIRLVGKMRYRSSYGQNLLMHSRETANLCATMAAEIGANVKLAKRAGLLHDIGKVSEDDPELSHAILGMQLCEKYKENPAVSNAVGAHHDEIEMKFLISPIVQACDAISGSRPGARREILEQYLKRIKDLEDMALDFKGVEKAYAIQAGRELRVIVESENVSDKQSDEISFELSQKIQDTMQYPGQIKVVVIREKRAVNFAK